MGKLLLSLHVVAAIVFIGPVTVAVSLFPRHARLALGGEASAVPVVHLLHRISRVYSVLGLSVPVLGIALAAWMRVLGEVWLVVSIGLTLGAGVLLALGVLPAQRRAVGLLEQAAVPAGPDRGAAVASDAVVSDAVVSDAVARWTAGAGRLTASSGVFALLWVVVVVLMVVRPGSTTGV